MIRLRLFGWVLAGAGLLGLAALLVGRGDRVADLDEPDRSAPVRSADTEPARQPESGVPEDFVPPEVLAAARGRPGDPLAGGHVPGADPGFRADGPAGDPPRAGDRRPVRREGIHADPPPLADESPDRERQRRLVWIDKQKRRNALRVEVMAERLGLDEAAAARFGEILDRGLADKVALYERIDPAAVDPAALTRELDAIRGEQAALLTELLGSARYEEYRRLDESGAFVLPEEKQEPPRDR